MITRNRDIDLDFSTSLSDPFSRIGLRFTRATITLEILPSGLQRPLTRFAQVHCKLYGKEYSLRLDLDRQTFIDHFPDSSDATDPREQLLRVQAPEIAARVNTALHTYSYSEVH